MCLFDFQNKLLGHETVRKKRLISVDFILKLKQRSDKKNLQITLTKRPESDVDFESRLD